MRRYSGGNIGGRNKPGSGVYSMPQHLQETIDNNWPSAGQIIYDETGRSHSQEQYGPWIRNPSWLSMPYVTSMNEKVVALVAVSNPTDYISFSATGDYTVDWGDGTVENFSSNTVASHTYSYSNPLLANTNAPVVLTSSSSTVNRTSHGYVDGNVVKLRNIQTTVGLQENVGYYVVNKTDNTFQLALTEGGSPVSFTGNGTANLLPYKQAILTVTPQAGQQLTTFNMQQYHSALGNRVYLPSWLDITVSGPNFNATGFTCVSRRAGELAMLHLLERVSIKNLGGQTSMFAFFCNLFNLRTYEISNATNVTDYRYMFYMCNNLYYAPGFIIGTGANCNNMFDSCGGLYELGDIDFSGAATVEQMFYYCTALTKFPELLDFSNCTSLVDLFRGCTLTKIPKMKFGVPWSGDSLFSNVSGLKRILPGDIDFSLCTSLNSFVYGTIDLEEVEIDDMGMVEDASFMFNDCYALKRVKINNLASVTEMYQFVYGAGDGIEEITVTSKTCPIEYLYQVFYQYNFSRLQKLSFFEGTSLPNLTSTSRMFYNTEQLKTINLFDTSNVTDMSQMFYGCTRLETIPAFDTSNVTDMSQMFSGCSSIKTIPLFDTSNVTNMNFMFGGCDYLKEVPLLDTSNVTDMSYMFYNCTSLSEVPNFNTSKVTNMNNMFQGSWLEKVPSFDMSNVTTATNMYQNTNLRHVPYLNMPKATSIYNMFLNCNQLESVGPINLASGFVDTQGMFAGCNKLESIGDISANTVVNAYFMFGNDYVLNRIPKMNVACTTGLITTYSSSICYNLSNVSAYGLNSSQDFSNGKLGKDDILYLFSNLSNTGATLTLTNNPGVRDLSSSITVTGNVGSKTIYSSNTTGVYVGAPVVGNGLSDMVTATYPSYYSGNTVFTKTYHGLANNDYIKFINPTWDYGYYYQIMTYGYVKEATANTFLLSKTADANSSPYRFYYGTNPGGFSLMFYRPSATVVDIVPNTSFNVTSTLLQTLTGNTLSILSRDVANATAKGWTIAF